MAYNRDTLDGVNAVNPYQAGTFAAFDWDDGASAARAEMRHAR